MLKLLNERGEIAQEIGKLKEMQGVKRFDPVQERRLLDLLAEHNKGPFETSTVQHLFKQIFKASLGLQEDDNRKALHVSRKKKPTDTIVTVHDEQIGDGSLHFFVCRMSVEIYEKVKVFVQEINKQVSQLLGGCPFRQ